MLSTSGGSVALYRDTALNYKAVTLSEDTRAKHAGDLESFKAALTGDAPKDKATPLILIPVWWMALPIRHHMNRKQREAFAGQQKKQVEELAQTLGCQLDV